MSKRLRECKTDSETVLAEAGRGRGSGKSTDRVIVVLKFLQVKSEPFRHFGWQRFRQDRFPNFSA
eukprot:768772-Hanusia_phi.AAC.5